VPLQHAAHVSVIFCYMHAKQDWKTVNNFHVRVRRKNPVTGKYVSFCWTFFVTWWDWNTWMWLIEIVHAASITVEDVIKQ